VSAGDSAADGRRFHRGVVASPDGLSVVREQLRGWLRQLAPPVSAVRVDDILLACYEAMANATEHAYHQCEPGEVVLDATYDDGKLSITVGDHGRWKDSSGEDPFRGRGVPLIKLLSDESSIDNTPEGTTVSMNWRDVTVEPS
jgi:anti-sigma regulatory factor (Ser/Thr protein kinase)